MHSQYIIYNDPLLFGTYTNIHLLTEGVVTVKITINSDDLPGFDSANIEDFLCNMLQECSTESARRMHETLQEHGRKVVSIIPGCILVTLMCPTLYSLRDLKEKCESGHLAQLCETALLANGFGMKDLSLHAEISEWDYKLCQAELEGKPKSSPLLPNKLLPR